MNPQSEPGPSLFPASAANRIPHQRRGASRLLSFGPGGLEHLALFLPVLRPYRARFGGILVLQTLGAGLGLLAPFLVQIAIDRIFIERKGELLLPLTLVLLGTSTLGLGLSGLSSYLYTWLTARVLLDLRLRLFRHLQRLPLRFYVRAKVGDLQMRMGSDLAEIQSFATDVPLTLVGSFLTLAGSIAFLIHYSPMLFGLAILFLPGAVFLVRRFQTRLHGEARRIRDENAELASQVQESFLGIRLIKAYRLERREARRFLRRNRSLLKKILGYQFLSILASSLPALLIGLGAVVIFYVGARQVLSGSLTLGALVAFGIYQARLQGPVQGLFGLYLRFQRVRAAMDRVAEILELEPPALETPGQASLAPLEGDIEFEHVRFGYEPGAEVLRDLSFRILPREKVALVGPSGVGKSTLLDLLFRFYDPSSGTIRVDGRPLPEIRIGSFLDQVAVVSQETFLFHASLRENILCGRPSADPAEVERAARLAGVSEFAATWPGGLDTLVGERGTALSGGQRQRVSIARAILRRPRLLVLDEATSQLDLEAEGALRRALKEIDPPCTLLAVTHRVDHLQEFDRVLLLEDGALMWEGTPLDWRQRLRAGRIAFDHMTPRAAGEAATEIHVPTNPAGSRGPST